MANPTSGDYYNNLMDKVKGHVMDAYSKGLREGIEMFAWSKDGIKYIGVHGMTLKDALEILERNRVKTDVKFGLVKQEATSDE